MTMQSLDHIIVDGELGNLHDEPLEEYLRLKKIEVKPEIFCTACYRGYIATWEVRENQLYLIGVKPYLGQGKIGIEDLIGTDGLEADWFSGKLEISFGKCLVEDYFPVYEKHLILTVARGCVVKSRVIQKPQ